MIIHTFMHILIGAYLYTIFFRPTNNREKIMIILSGGLIGIFPDVTKFFGDLWLHSIITIPIIGLLFALLLYSLLRINLLKGLWISMVTVFLSHHLIDYLGNGINLLYPITGDEVELDVIPKSMEVIIIFVLLLGFILYLSKLSFKYYIMPLIVIILLLLVQVTSSLTIQHKLDTRLHPATITMTPENQLLHWEFDVRLADTTIIKGSGAYLDYKIDHTTPPPKE